MVPLSKSGLRYKRSVGSNPTLSATRLIINGEVLEWSIRRAWRARVAFGYRGFESHPLRHYISIRWLLTHVVPVPTPAITRLFEPHLYDRIALKMTDKDLKYWVGFSLMPGIGRVRFAQLENHFGSLEGAWQATSTELKKAGLDRNSVQAITTWQPKISLDDEMEKLARYGV